MSFKNLLEPITENGIKNVNYFEGRLLTAQDLKDQELANKRHRQQLAQTFGHGVIDGLDVSILNAGGDGAEPTVKVKKGRAINLNGDIVDLPFDVDIVLSRSLDVASNGNSNNFKNCDKFPPLMLTPNGAGIYFLLALPARIYSEYALKSGLQAKGIADECGRAYQVEGVQFRLVKFDPAGMPDISDETRAALLDDLVDTANPAGVSDLKRLSMMRNLVAHVCFGTDEIRQSATTPAFLDNPATTNGLDALLGTEGVLSSQDVPLAMVYWTLDGIVFVDNWAVKRKASHRDIVGHSIPMFTRFSYARADESRLQFQEHLEFLQNHFADASAFSVAEYFRYLPPFGYLPIQEEGVAGGFTEEAFFKNLTVRNSVFIEASQLVPVSQTAMTYWPIDLTSGELIWLYRTRENAQAKDNGAAGRTYLLFASGHSPYAGNARFNVSKWDYSNFGLI